MFRRPTFLAALATVVIAIALAGRFSTNSFAAPPKLAVLESFWTCPSGYTFETDGGNAVHCKKPAWTETKPYIACTGLFPTTKIDLVGTTDMCAGTGAAGVATSEPICNPVDVGDGYTKRHVSGKDFCGKNHPAEVMAPNTRVSR